MGEEESGGLTRTVDKRAVIEWIDFLVNQTKSLFEVSEDVECSKFQKVPIKGTTKGFIGVEGNEGTRNFVICTLSPPLSNLNLDRPIRIFSLLYKGQWFSKKISSWPDISKSRRNGGSLSKSVRAFNARLSKGKLLRERIPKGTFCTFEIGGQML